MNANRCASLVPGFWQAMPFTGDKLPPAISCLSDSDDDAVKPSTTAPKRLQKSYVQWSGETGSTKAHCELETTDLPTGKVSIEVFSGSGNLSAALSKKGFATLEYDLLKDAQHDMTNPKFVNYLKQLPKKVNLKYCHLAPPCNTYSQARYPKIRTANESIV